MSGDICLIWVLFYKLTRNDQKWSWASSVILQCVHFKHLIELESSHYITKIQYYKYKEQEHNKNKYMQIIQYNKPFQFIFQKIWFASFAMRQHLLTKFKLYFSWKMGLLRFWKSIFRLTYLIPISYFQTTSELSYKKPTFLDHSH